MHFLSFIMIIPSQNLDLCYCSIVDERPKRYRANYKQCCEKAEVPTGPTMYRRSFNRIVSRKRPAWPWPREHVVENVRGGAKTNDKGMLRDKDELTVSVSWEVREGELRFGESVVRVRENIGTVVTKVANQLFSCLNYNTSLWLVHVKQPSFSI